MNLILKENTRLGALTTLAIDTFSDFVIHKGMCTTQLGKYLEWLKAKTQIVNLESKTNYDN